MNDKRSPWWPLALMLAVFAVTRWPGLLPPSFSAAYALVFCVGVFRPAPRALGITLAVMLATDLALNAYYQFVKGWECFTPVKMLYLLANYAGYGLLYGLGRAFRPAADWAGGKGRRLGRVVAACAALLGGGVLGAAIFYLVTNTASWLLNPFHNPEYTRNLAGWLRALTMGTGGHPPTWEFFRNTLLSGGLFTGLFAAAWGASSPAESRLEKELGDAPEAAEEEPAPT